MSRGPGSIEIRIGDLFTASQDRALSVNEIAAHAFALDGNPPTRAQRSSTIRAAHRVIRRTQEMDEKRVPLLRAAEERIRAALDRRTDTSPTRVPRISKAATGVADLIQR